MTSPCLKPALPPSLPRPRPPFLSPTLPPRLLQRPWAALISFLASSRGWKEEGDRGREGLLQRPLSGAAAAPAAAAATIVMMSTAVAATRAAIAAVAEVKCRQPSFATFPPPRPPRRWRKGWKKGRRNPSITAPKRLRWRRQRMRRAALSPAVKGEGRGKDREEWWVTTPTLSIRRSSPSCPLPKQLQHQQQQ